jgi:hypothetical protein
LLVCWFASWLVWWFSGLVVWFAGLVCKFGLQVWFAGLQVCRFAGFIFGRLCVQDARYVGW